MPRLRAREYVSEERTACGFGFRVGMWASRATDVIDASIKIVIQKFGHVEHLCRLRIVGFVLDDAYSDARCAGRITGAGTIDAFIEAFVVNYIFLSALDARKNSS